MHCSRRRFLKSAGAAAAFSASPLRGFSLPALSAIPSPCFLQTGSGYAPFVERFLQHIQPGADGFLAEKYAAELTSELNSWQNSFLASTRDLHEVHDLLSETLNASLLNRAQVTPLRAEPPVHSDKALFAPAEQVSRGAFVEALNEYLAPFSKVEIAELQIGLIEIVHDQPLALKTKIYYDLIGESGASQREERTGQWELSWLKDSSEKWQIGRAHV